MGPGVCGGGDDPHELAAAAATRSGAPKDTGKGRVAGSRPARLGSRFLLFILGDYRDSATS